MQLYGCNIGALYGVDEVFDIYLIGLPKSSEKIATLYLWGANIQMMLPKSSLVGIKLLIFRPDMAACNICDIEVEDNTLMLAPLLQEHGISTFIHEDEQVLHQLEKEVITIGKSGFYSLSVKDRRKECQKVYLHSACLNVLGRKIERAKYYAIVTPEEKKSTYSTVLKKIVNGSKLEVEDMLKLFTNDDEIVVPFHIDVLKDFAIYTPEFSFAYNQIDAILNVIIRAEKYVIKDDLFTTLPDMIISKICFSIRDNTLEEDIKEYFV